MPDTAGLGDIWIRASRLAETCTLSFDVVAHPPGWRVMIAAKNAPTMTVHATAQHLLEAVASAVEQAESRGMARAAR